jgi:quinol monooxygenase YgiN
MGMVINWIKEALDKSTGLHPRDKPLNDGSEALRLVVSLTVSDENKFLEYAQELATASRLELGCLDYTFAKVEESEENEYLFVELWTSQESLSAHNLSPHYVQFFPLIREVITITQVIKALVPTY